MANHTSDPVARALSELDTGTRALLDLSLRRGLDDDGLAKLVRADPDEIARRRERTLDEIAAEAGIEGPGAREQVTERLLAVPTEVWLASSGPDEAKTEPAPPPPPAAGPLTSPPAAKPTPAVARPPIKDPRRTVGTQGASVGPPRSQAPAPVARESTADGSAPSTGDRNRVMVILTLALAAVLLAILLLTAGGSDDASPLTTPPPTDGPAQPTPTDGPPAEQAPKLSGEPLESLPGAGGEGSVEVRLEGKETIVASLDGLPAPGGDVYKLWLYNSIIDSEGLGTTGSASGSIEARLPANAERFRFLDLTMQPRKQASTHNGRSLFRAPLSQVETA